MDSLHAIFANQIRPVLFLSSCLAFCGCFQTSKLGQLDSDGQPWQRRVPDRPREMAHCLNFGDKPSVTLTGQKLLCGSPRELPKMVACWGHVGSDLWKAIQSTPWSGLELCQLVFKSLSSGELWENEFQLLPALGGNQNIKDLRKQSGK